VSAWCKAAFVLCVITLSAYPGIGWAQQVDDPVSASIEELKRAILTRDRVIKDLFIRVKKLESSVEAMAVGDAPETTSASQQDADREKTEAAAIEVLAEDGQAGQQPPGEQPLQPPTLNEEQKREQEQLIRTSFERTLIVKGGLLLPPGTVEVNPSVSYTHASSDNIVIDGFTILPVLVIGDIFSERVRRQSVQSALSVRVGLPRDYQAEIRVPYGYQHLKKLSADSEETTQRGAGLGDIDLTLSHQFLRGSGSQPDLLGSFTWKTTTGSSPLKGGDGLRFGSGYHSLRASMTAVKVTDPVVFYGSPSYTRSAPVTEEIGRFNPGNTFGLALGMAIALNLDTAISFGYEQHLTQASTLDGVDVPGSSISTGTFTIGSSYSLGQSVSMDFSLGIGLTADAPDMQMSVSVPFRLSL